MLTITKAEAIEEGAAAFADVLDMGVPFERYAEAIIECLEKHGLVFAGESDAPHVSFTPERIQRELEVCEAARPGAVIGPAAAAYELARVSLPEALREIGKLSAIEAENKRLREALEPFAQAAREFTCAVGPDGIDDGMTVFAHIHARPEHEAKLSTADFSRASKSFYEGRDKTAAEFTNELGAHPTAPLHKPALEAAFSTLAMPDSELHQRMVRDAITAYLEADSH